MVPLSPFRRQDPFNVNCFVQPSLFRLYCFPPCGHCYPVLFREKHRTCSQEFDREGASDFSFKSLGLSFQSRLEPMLVCFIVMIVISYSGSQAGDHTRGHYIMFYALTGHLYYVCVAPVRRELPNKAGSMKLLLSRPQLFTHVHECVHKLHGASQETIFKKVIKW